MRSLVIIPTYNEIENIHKMLDTVLGLQPSFDLLVVDDGSPTGRRKPFSLSMDHPEQSTC